MDTIPAGLANGVGVVAVVLLVGWMIWTGRLVPRPLHDAAVKDLREQNAALRETNKHLAEQNSVMLGASMPAFNSLLSALRQAAGESP